MAEVVVVDLGNVTVDGVIAGSVLDVAANRQDVEGIKGLTLTALQVWLAARDQAGEDKLAAKELELAASVQEHTAALAAKDVQIADLEAQVDALGGPELAQQKRREAAIALKQAEMERLRSELAEMGVED